jgi:FkbM family methyltransferase
MVRAGLRWLTVQRGPGEGAPVGSDPARLLRDEFGIHASLENAYLADGLAHLRALKAEGARFQQDERGRIICAIAGIRMFIRDSEELEILREIFVDHVYDIDVPGPCVIWDIGMNVGLAALYFAARGNTQVIGYEPIASTYRLALENLQLNPRLLDAITAVDRGIGASERTEEVDFCPGRKGSVGLRGGVSEASVRRLVFHLPVDTPLWKEPLPMLDAVSVLRSIRARHAQVPIVAKIDCEGAEYEIVEALHAAGELASLHALVIEWHGDGPDRLRSRLVDAGFTVLAPGLSRGLWGKLYAVR